MTGVAVTSGLASRELLEAAGAQWVVERIAVLTAELRRRGIVTP
jgi:hypothetical protein